MTEPASWCTNWAAYDLPRLWQMVSDEDNEHGWVQVQAWFRLRGAVEAHRQRLYACREALRAQWPPEQSRASEAFIAYLDYLIASMTETAASAESTARGLGGIMNALATAKAEIKALYNEWDASSTDLVPRWWDNAEDNLDSRARDIMRRAELAVADYTPMIEIPPKYEPGVRRDSGETMTAPSATIDRVPNSISAVDTRASGLLSAVPHDPPTPLSMVPLTGDPAVADGPTLATISQTFPITGQPAGTVDASPNVFEPVSRLPIAGPIFRESSKSTPVETDRSKPNLPIAPSERSKIPIPQPGGPTPYTSSPIVGAPLGPRSGNLVGTSTRGSDERLGTTFRSSTIHHTSYGHLVAQPVSRISRFSTESCNPQAVPPVITPQVPRPHDPGPGIIGLDR